MPCSAACHGSAREASGPGVGWRGPSILREDGVEMNNRTSAPTCSQHAHQDGSSGHDVDGSLCVTEVRNLRDSFSLAAGLLQDLVGALPEDFLEGGAEIKVEFEYRLLDLLPVPEDKDSTGCLSEMRNLDRDFSTLNGLLQELVNLAPDPDQGLDVKPELEARLLADGAKKQYIRSNEMKRQLGL